jgi:predicted nucleotidyltransferase
LRAVNERVEIRRISAPAFVATKLEALLDRGCGDFLSSHDLEDVLIVVDGRPSIVDELRIATPDLRQFVHETIGSAGEKLFFLNDVGVCRCRASLG